RLLSSVGSAGKPRPRVRVRYGVPRSCRPSSSTEGLCGAGGAQAAPGRSPNLVPAEQHWITQAYPRAVGEPNGERRYGRGTEGKPEPGGVMELDVQMVKRVRFSGLNPEVPDDREAEPQLDCEDCQC